MNRLRFYALLEPVIDLSFQDFLRDFLDPDAEQDYTYSALDLMEVEDYAGFCRSLLGQIERGELQEILKEEIETIQERLSPLKITFTANEGEP